MGALLLFLVSPICVNLAAVATLLLQGIGPANWWQKDRAARTARISMGIWVVLLATLVGLVLLLRSG